MKISFAAKLGIIISLVICSITGGALYYYYSVAYDLLISQMQGRLKDIGRAGSYLFSEEDRLDLHSFHKHLEKNLPKDYRLRLKKGETSDVITVFNPEQAKLIHQSPLYKTFVQKLRRVQYASGEKVYPDQALSQSVATTESDPSIISVYLMAPITNIDPRKGLMFLADSNYEDMDSNQDGLIQDDEKGNAVGNFYKGEGNLFGLPFINGNAQVSPGFYTDIWGTFMTSIVPIKLSNGQVVASLGIDYDVTVYTRRIDEVYQTSISIFIVALTLGLLLALAITLLVHHPLGKLKIAAQKLLNKDFNFDVKLTNNDEFGLLATTFNNVGQELQLYTSDLESVVAKRTQELEGASQRIKDLNDILSKENQYLGAEVENILKLRNIRFPNQTINIKNFKITYQYHPTRSLGGIGFDTNDSGGFISNVSGYGLETSLMALMLFEFQSVLSMQELTTADVLNIINQRFIRLNNTVELRRHTDLLQFLLTEEPGEIIFSGNWYDSVFSGATGIDEVSMNFSGSPLGISEQLNADKQLHFCFKPGEKLYLFNPGFRRALSQRLHVNNTISPEAMLGYIRQIEPQEISQFLSLSDHDEFEEDIFLLCFEYTGSDSKRSD